MLYTGYIAHLVVLSKECVFLIAFWQKKHDVRQDNRQHIYTENRPHGAQN